MSSNDRKLVPARERAFETLMNVYRGAEFVDETASKVLERELMAAFEQTNTVLSDNPPRDVVRDVYELGLNNTAKALAKEGPDGLDEVSSQQMMVWFDQAIENKQENYTKLADRFYETYMQPIDLGAEYNRVLDAAGGVAHMSDIDGDYGVEMPDLNGLIDLPDVDVLGIDAIDKVVLPDLEELRTGDPGVKLPLYVGTEIDSHDVVLPKIEELEADNFGVKLPDLEDLEADQQYADRSKELDDALYDFDQAIDQVGLREVLDNPVLEGTYAEDVMHPRDYRAFKNVYQEVDRLAVAMGLTDVQAGKKLRAPTVSQESFSELRKAFVSARDNAVKLGMVDEPEPQEHADVFLDEVHRTERIDELYMDFAEEVQKSNVHMYMAGYADAETPIIDLMPTSESEGLIDAYVELKAGVDLLGEPSQDLQARLDEADQLAEDIGLDYVAQSRLNQQESEHMSLPTLEDLPDRVTYNQRSDEIARKDGDKVEQTLDELLEYHMHAMGDFPEVEDEKEKDKEKEEPEPDNDDDYGPDF